MTTLSTQIYTVLTASTLITSLTTTRIYPVIIPQNATLPHIVYNRVSGDQVNGLAGYLTMEKPKYQIDVYSDSYEQARTLAGRVHTVLNSSTLSVVLLSDTDLYEDNVSQYRVTSDYSFINNE